MNGSFASKASTAALLLCGLTAAAGAQAPSTSAPGAAAKAPAAAPTSTATSASASLPTDYVIGPDDVLTVVFWRDKEMSSEVAVRPDGKVSLPLVNELMAAGLTPEQFRLKVTEAAVQFVEDPTVSIIVKQINSRKVFITGQVSRPGPYPLAGPTTVVQLIAMAGGVQEYADEKNISIMRTENGQPVSLKFNYEEVKKRKNLQQNVQLKPGDTIIVP